MSISKQTECWVVLFATVVFAPSSLADWPEFRGPTGHGVVVPERPLPLVWSDQQNVVWRTQLPGEGWSSPVVVGQSVYLTAAIADEGTNEKRGYDLALLIVDVRTGAITKRVSLFWEGSDSPQIHGKNSHASPTPVSAGSRLYVHFGHQGTACTTHDGDVIWKNDSLGYEPVHGNGGSPVVIDDLLILSRDGADISEITALDAQTGRIVWRTQRNVEPGRPFSFSTPLLLQIDGRRQLISPGTDVVQSLDPKTGKEQWRLTYKGYSVVPRPIYESGLVFISTGFNTPHLLAIDPTGHGDVTDSHVTWQAKSNIPKTSSLVGFDGKIAMVSDMGVASCLDAQTGKLIWKKRVGGNYSASPILCGDNLYLLSEEGTCTI